MALNYVYVDNQLDSVKDTAKKFHRIFGYDSQGSVELIKNLDSNGALKNTTVIQNNFEGQIVSVDKFTPTTDLFLNAFFYDGFGKRIKTVNTKGAATTNSYSFYGQNGKLMYSYKDGNHTDYIFLGSKLVARTETKPESVPRVKHMHYKPFGEVVEGDEGKIGYTGHKFDTDLGLNYMQARYYDPVIGRFYSNDPISVRDVHSFNRYAYANNNPYKYIDPTGMIVECTSGAEQCSNLANEINKLTDKVYEFDKNGNLTDTGKSNEKGSEYYSSKLDEAIKGSNTISVSVGDKIKNSRGAMDDVNSAHGGGATAKLTNGNAQIVVSGSSSRTNSGFKLPSEWILAHEFVGHAIPHTVSGDTGNAVKNTNKIRKQLGVRKRRREGWHDE